MSLERRNEYLRAMGIEIWIPRVTAALASDFSFMPVLKEEIEALQPGTGRARGSAVAGRIFIGPGTSSTLFLCGKPDEAATALAADIARSLDCEPVWSWPAQDGSVPGMPLEQAIEERLFTRVLVFGPGLVAPAAGSAVEVIGCARLIRADSIPVLVASGAARRALWTALNEH